jgi:hypothetical protein
LRKENLASTREKFAQRKFFGKPMCGFFGRISSQFSPIKKIGWLNFVKSLIEEKVLKSEI